MTKQTGWWYRASKEQRLEQIRAGIELGMTSSQVAMNCGCYYSQSAYGDGGGLVRSFAPSLIPTGFRFLRNCHLAD